MKRLAPLRTILLSLLAICASASAAELEWPLKLRPILTSGFAEYRTGHPHAGIDLGTNQAVGVPVVAVADGSITRLRTSPHGYGKVVYLTLDDGRIAVYAHLDGFADKISKLVESYQGKNNRYSINEFLEPETLRVKRGEVLGWSGVTGTDVPHLHFEIRGSDNCPTNPLLNGFPIADQKPPTPTRLRLTPLDGQSLVSGWSRPRVWNLVKKSEVLYSLDEAPSVWGKLGVELEVHDASDTSQRWIAPYRITLLADQQRAFELRHDRYCYERKWIIDHQFNFGPKLKKAGEYFRLFNKFGARIAFYQGAQDGKLELIDHQKHQIKIFIADALGNQSEVRFELLANRPPEITMFDFQALGNGFRLQAVAEDPDGESPDLTAVLLDKDKRVLQTIELKPTTDKLREARIGGDSHAEYLRLTAQDRNGLADRQTFWLGAGQKETPKIDWQLIERDGYLDVELSPQFALRRFPLLSVTLKDPSGFHQTVKLESRLRAFGQSSYRGTVPLPPDRDLSVFMQAGVRTEDRRIWLAERDLELKLVDGGEKLFSEDGLTQIEFADNSVYYPFHIQVLEESLPGFKGLEPVGRAYRLTREAMPFAQNPTLRLSLPAGEAPDQVGIYMIDEDRAWYLGRQRAGGGGAYTVGIAHLGRYALYRDRSDPWLAELDPAEGEVVSDTEPTIIFNCGDSGSGLYEDGIEVRLDGRILIAEWHPFKGKVEASVRQPLAQGEHAVEISLTDKAGNSVHRSIKFTVRPK